MTRRHNFQNVGWFFDLYERGRLNLEPPYQRRSVWNQKFKDDFIDTVLLGYPAPALFLYEELAPDGRATYHVVDGKQRLTALFEFAEDQFPVSDRSALRKNAGQYFSQLDADTKKSFWGYQFTVEYVPEAEEQLLNNIFDRINRNVAKLTPQELRHARFDGKFISEAENLAQWMSKSLPENFPRIQEQSRKQMKDVELAGLLLLLIEEGPNSYSQTALDDAFAARDESWESQAEIVGLFTRTIEAIRSILTADPEVDLTQTRLRNQADFYSFFGACLSFERRGTSLDRVSVARRLARFLEVVEDEDARRGDTNARSYYEAARSASNDKGPRERRIKEILRVMEGPSDGSP